MDDLLALEPDAEQANAYAVALTAALRLNRAMREAGTIDPATGKRPRVTSLNVYWVAEDYGFDVGEAVTITPKPTANHKPRSKPVGKPAKDHINDDGTITCPSCHERRPEKKYPTIKDGTRDFRECRPCIHARRNHDHNN